MRRGMMLVFVAFVLGVGFGGVTHAQEAPSPEIPAAAWTPVARNSEWTPFEYEFDGIVMVLVPVGAFRMGTSEEEAALVGEWCLKRGTGCEDLLALEVPAHPQEFHEPFWIGKYEVSNADTGKEGCDERYSAPEQPHNCVSWEWAHEFCEARGMRLPTEAEWEYAARGPENWIFPWGNAFDGLLANHCDRNCAEMWEDPAFVASEFDDGFIFTAPVGSYPGGASWVGAHDMSGNVFEWTSTRMQDYAYDAEDGRERDAEPLEATQRVVRGGSFLHTYLLARTTMRMGFDARIAVRSIGFRCVRSLDAEAAD